MRLVFATHNEGKLVELRRLCAGIPGFTVSTLAELGVPDDVVEDGETLADNARKKAVSAYRRTGLLALADDSGLMVDALGGAPGVYSARYGGEPRSDERNRQALLRALAALPAPGGVAAPRTAYFACCLCLCPAGPGLIGGQGLADAQGLPDDKAPPVSYYTGTVHGTLIDAPRGASGFGYDPLFVPDAEEIRRAGLDTALVGRTLAELSLADKNRLSHRGRAMASLVPALLALAG